MQRRVSSQSKIKTMIGGHCTMLVFLGGLDFHVPFFYQLVYVSGTDLVACPRSEDVQAQALVGHLLLFLHLLGSGQIDVQLRVVFLSDEIGSGDLFAVAAHPRLHFLQSFVGFG